jgi:hypothetical protein
MKIIALAFVASIFAVPSAVLADAKQLTCSVALQDTQRVLKPRSELGRDFSTFTLNATQDPKGWVHQNRCAVAKDFRGASFAGYLCLVVITGAGSEDPSGPFFLSVDISRDSVELDSRGSPRLSLRPRSRGASRLLVPIDARGETIEVQHTFATKGGRGDLHQLSITCRG